MMLMMKKAFICQGYRFQTIENGLSRRIKIRPRGVVALVFKWGGGREENKSCLCIYLRTLDSPESADFCPWSRQFCPVAEIQAFMWGGGAGLRFSDKITSWIMSNFKGTAHFHRCFFTGPLRNLC